MNEINEMLQWIAMGIGSIALVLTAYNHERHLKQHRSANDAERKEILTRLVQAKDRIDSIGRD